MAGRWFSLGTLVSSINITDCYNITEILLKVALNTIYKIYTEARRFFRDFPLNGRKCFNIYVKKL
jgi:hypothetical protein